MFLKTVLRLWARSCPLIHSGRGWRKPNVQPAWGPRSMIFGWPSSAYASGLPLGPYERTDNANCPLGLPAIFEAFFVIPGPLMTV